MEIERWDPWKELNTLHREVNRLFDSFFGRISPQTERDIALSG